MPKLMALARRVCILVLPGKWTRQNSRCHPFDGMGTMTWWANVELVRIRFRSILCSIGPWPIRRRMWCPTSRCMSMRSPSTQCTTIYAFWPMQCCGNGHQTRQTVDEYLVCSKCWMSFRQKRKVTGQHMHICTFGTWNRMQSYLPVYTATSHRDVDEFGQCV